jgi:hypothetical protein
MSATIRSVAVARHVGNPGPRYRRQATTAGNWRGLGALDKMELMKRSLHLAVLEKGLRGLSPGHCLMLCECAAVCLENREHRQDVALVLRGQFKTRHKIRWTPTTEQMRRGWADLREATDKGACGVAILVVLHKTKFTIVDRSVIGTGFDYWLGDEEAPPDRLFDHKARLEVSGILNGTEADVHARSRAKTKQMQRTNRALPGFAVVVEFSTPQAHVSKR